MKYNHAIIHTTKGDIYIDLFGDVSNTVSNFIMHCKMGFYKDTSFYRVEGFCIQGGRLTPFGKYKAAPIAHEITYHRHGQYSVAMADAGIGTADTTFFINKAENEWLNGRYIVFGQVVKGLHVIWAIKKDDKILDIEVK